MILKKRYCVFFLIAYILFFFYFAVLNRDIEVNPIVKLSLFNSYYQLDKYSSRDILNNIIAFFPVGVMVGMVADKFRLLKAIVVGLIVSTTVEFSQLIWQRGTFDVDDLLNNAIGAFVGGSIVTLCNQDRASRK